ncbi:hypothetical protein QUF80_19155 [Desulfococcaceae bacterium HSG8]|nr:hypothetical protein [Desulfococcaceae bacterium HSG8]
MKIRSFFSKIISDLKSERETRISREQDTIEISYPAISREDLRNNWHSIPIMLFFSLACVIGVVLTLKGIMPSFTEMPDKTPLKEIYILLLPILIQVISGIAISVFVYRKAIRPLFITEKLTLDPSYFIYSLGTWGTFKEIIRIEKSDLVSFETGGNSCLISRLLSKGSSSERKNHLYVHYKKNKKNKREIMGGRSDDEYREMIDILESYRMSDDIYNMAKSVKERKQTEKTEQSASESEKKVGWIKGIRRLLSSEPLEENDCLKANGIIGLLTLPSIFYFFMADKNKLPFPPEFVCVPIIAGTVLAGGYLLAAYNSSMTKNILVLQGTVICLLVFVYTLFMWHVAQLMTSGKMKGGMGACARYSGLRGSLRDKAGRIFFGAVLGIRACQETSCNLFCNRRML